jgi:hypothetical protein
MTVIKVPTPPASAYDPNRPMSALLKMQVEHLQEAERRLPSRYRSEIYTNAIKTEGEAAKYVRAVTEAIHQAHADAERTRQAAKRKYGLEIAPGADRRAEQRPKRKGRKSSGKKTSAKKKKR